MLESRAIKKERRRSFIEGLCAGHTERTQTNTPAMSTGVYIIAFMSSLQGADAHCTEGVNV
jgi:hypothetical protein